MLNNSTSKKSLQPRNYKKITTFLELTAKKTAHFKRAVI